MKTIGIGKKGFGLIIGVATAILALMAIVSGKHRPTANTLGRYDGWYDSLGV